MSTLIAGAVPSWRRDDEFWEFIIEAFVHDSGVMEMGRQWRGRLGRRISISSEAKFKAQSTLF
jgi:hypothetical protein